MELLVVFGGLIFVLMFMFFSGSKVDPEDNAVWDSPTTKARKRRTKYIKMYRNEIELCNQLGINKQDMYVRWYHRHGDIYISNNLLNCSDLTDTLVRIRHMLHTRYISKGIEQDKIHRKQLASAAGIDGLTLDFLIEEELI